MFLQILTHKLIKELVNENERSKNNSNCTCTHSAMHVHWHICITQLYFIVFPSVIAQAKPEECKKNYSFAECETSHASLWSANRLQQSHNLNNGASALIVLLHPSTPAIMTNVCFFKHVSRHAAAIALSISSLSWHKSAPLLVLLYMAHACPPLIRSRDVSCFLPSYWDNSR